MRGRDARQWPPRARARPGLRRHLRRLAKRGRRHATALVALLGAGLICGMPLEAARALGVTLGRLAFHLLRRERRRALENLRRAFPGRGEAAIRGLARDVFLHFGRTFGELAWAHRRPLDRIERRIPIEIDWEAFERQWIPGRGVVVATAHLGAWEFFGLLASRRYRGRVLCVARRIRFAPYQALVERLRRRMGVRTLDQHASPRIALRWLRRGRILALLPDQDIRRLAGTFVPFFGRPAWTPTGPAALARTARAPLIPFYLIRDRDAYRIRVWPAIVADPHADREVEIGRLTEAWTRALEAEIRRYPEQWAWFHRRWRTQRARSFSNP